jgi:A/G-specific adenine glycosylase
VVALLHEALLPWFERVQRDLPWRRTKDPYAVWLSEVMLQQTRVEAVIPYFERFLRELPDVRALAEAPSEQVMKLWSGLGYYRRARMLHEAAQQIMSTRAGRFPDTVAELSDIRGIGRYTAGAVGSIAFGERAPLVDGNVVRVLSRIFALEGDLRSTAGMNRVWAVAEAILPPSRAGDWNQALMELGATTCIPRAPRCLVCPVQAVCAARARGLERELPYLAPKAEPVVRRRVAVVATVRGKVVLVRRSPGGLFGGLWEPPSVAEPAGSGPERRAVDELSALLGVELSGVTRAGRVSHVLSHRRLETEVLSGTLARTPRKLGSGAEEYEALSVVAKGDLATLGLSTYASRILACAGVVLPAQHRV